MTSAPSSRPQHHHPHHPVFARLYAWLSTGMEQTGYARHRDELLAGLSGRVVEVGCGNGMNFRHYPDTVDEVLAVEPEPYLRRRAREAAREAPVPIEVTDGIAEELPQQDGTFDGAVASLMLCSVEAPDDALAELFRVVRPGGELRFFEHVRATTPGLDRAQRVLDATFWPHVAGGCHTHRDTVATIEATGFDVQRIERFREPESRLVPVAPHVLGVARRP